MQFIRYNDQIITLILKENWITPYFSFTTSKELKPHSRLAARGVDEQVGGRQGGWIVDNNE